MSEGFNYCLIRQTMQYSIMYSYRIRNQLSAKTLPCGRDKNRQKSQKIAHRVAFRDAAKRNKHDKNILTAKLSEDLS